MTTLHSSFPCGGAGVSTPASSRRRCFKFCGKIASLTAITAFAWLAGNAIGELLGAHQLSSVRAGLPTTESLSKEVAATLQKQGVCLDAPPFSSALQPDTEARISLLQDQLAVEMPCVDLAIAQKEFETLQIETATLNLIERKRSFTTGFVADAVNYRSRSHRRISVARKP